MIVASVGVLLSLQLPKYRKAELYMDLDCSFANCVIRGNVKLTLYHDKLPAPVKVVTQPLLIGHYPC
jgi:hypothetical protein